MLFIHWFIFKVEVGQQGRSYSSVSNDPPDGEDARPTGPARLMTQSGPPHVPPPTEWWLIVNTRSGATMRRSLARASHRAAPTIEVIKPYWPPRTVNFKKAANAKGHERKSFVSGRHFSLTLS